MAQWQNRQSRSGRRSSGCVHSITGLCCHVSQAAQDRLTKRQDDIRAARAELAGVQRDAASEGAAAQQAQAAEQRLKAMAALLTGKTDAARNATVAALVRGVSKAGLANRKCLRQSTHWNMCMSQCFRRATDLGIQSGRSMTNCVTSCSRRRSCRAANGCTGSRR